MGPTSRASREPGECPQIRVPGVAIDGQDEARLLLQHGVRGRLLVQDDEVGAGFAGGGDAGPFPVFEAQARGDVAQLLKEVGELTRVGAGDDDGVGGRCGLRDLLRFVFFEAQQAEHRGSGAALRRRAEADGSGLHAARTLHLVSQSAHLYPPCLRAGCRRYPPIMGSRRRARQA